MGLYNTMKPALFHEILNLLQMNIFIANKLRQADRLIQSFVLFFPEGIIPTDGENTIKFWHVPINCFNYCLCVCVFEEIMCGPLCNLFPCGHTILGTFQF